jgi:hypothetical protein
MTTEVGEVVAVAVTLAVAVTAAVDMAVVAMAAAVTATKLPLAYVLRNLPAIFANTFRTEASS